MELLLINKIKIPIFYDNNIELNNANSISYRNQRDIPTSLLEEIPKKKHK